VSKGVIALAIAGSIQLKCRLPIYLNPMQSDICLDCSKKLLLGSLGLLAFGGVLIVTIEYLRNFWLPLTLGLIGLLTLLVIRSPTSICFAVGSRTLEIRYPLGGLLRKNEAVRFSEIIAIQSYPRIAGESDAEVALEILLENNRRITLDRAAPEWAANAQLIGLSGCREPTSIASLRQAIADLVGMENRGFLGG
jgi:hypothetical protein